MLQSRFKKAAGSIAIAATLALGAAGTAQAIVYKGSWDPAFGADFAGLGWRGEATFEVPASCLLATGTCTAPGMSMLSADVVFYDLLHPNTTLDMLHFGTASTNVSMVVDSNHKLSGVVGDFGYFVQSANYAPGTYFDLLFHGDWAQLQWKSKGECEDDRKKSRSSEDESCGGFSDRLLSGGPFIAFAPAVPEPSTYALFAAGLAAMWQIRRRRR